MNDIGIINLIIIIGLGIMPIILSIVLLGIIISIFKDKKQSSSTTSIKKEISDKKLEFLLQDDFIDKVDKIIDTLIINAGNKYMALNVNYDKEKYITEGETETIKLYIYGTVKKSMTPAIKELISLVYDISTDKKLEELLLLKINMYLLATLINNHKPL